ncbi:hypothetical protein PIROE2DRAFT_4344 [Piromyces sp. E2]|nr:hypothetical protein PIROE2DRAFT_4344 [Piromyces sp. E2]|eukprot:OUM68060.1 hypothetical protein PIROE2DRAFT_4344 [Piromyces sp. E2]
MENVIISNSYTSNGYLFDIYGHKLENQHINIRNLTFSDSSSLLHGDVIKVDIENSVFKNITKNTFSPLVSNSKFSTFNISNTKFTDLILSNGLLNEESQCTLNNIKIDNVKSNGRALLYFINNNIIINNSEFDNINCMGDINYSSLILFNSEDANVKLNLNNIVIKNSNSNGPLIKIDGNSNEFLIKNSKISKISSYGPIIEVLSKKV